MPCYYPLDGWRAKSCNDNGRYPIVFEKSLAQVDEWIKISCGRCIGCRLEQSRQWAMRCTHEASMYEDNCFITLTYNDENLPTNGSLDICEWQNFMKRLRKQLAPQKIRFFACGEYGVNQDITNLDTIGRPHYHAILFGHDLRERHTNGKLNDKYLHSVNNDQELHTSPALERVWKKGFSTIGNCTFESAAYVARYCLKKITGDEAGKHYGSRLPEFSTQSRNPGIARSWFEKYRHDLDKGFITCKGIKLPTAKYYSDLYAEHYEQDYEPIKENIRQSIDIYDPENQGDRLRVREQIKLRRIKQLKREIY